MGLSLNRRSSTNPCNGRGRKNPRRVQCCAMPSHGAVTTILIPSLMARLATLQLRSIESPIWRIAVIRGAGKRQIAPLYCDAVGYPRPARRAYECYYFYSPGSGNKSVDGTGGAL